MHSIVYVLKVRVPLLGVFDQWPLYLNMENHKYSAVVTRQCSIFDISAPLVSVDLIGKKELS